jgi:hypothetical protein
MVYYFKSSAVDPPAFIYVGKDKEESAFSSTPGRMRLTAQTRISSSTAGRRMSGKFAVGCYGLV